MNYCSVAHCDVCLSTDDVGKYFKLKYSSSGLSFWLRPEIPESDYWLLHCCPLVCVSFNGKELSVEYTQSNTTILPLLLL